MLKLLEIKKENCPGLSFIGKKYTSGGHWGEWWENGWFSVLEALADADDLPAMNDSGYTGLCRTSENGFEYWIGMFFASGTTVPDGFDMLEIAAGDFAVCYLYGNESNGEIFSADARKLCEEGLIAARLEPMPAGIMFERYNCPRYTSPDEHGHVILDLAFELR